MIDVAIQHLHASVSQEERIEAVFSGCFEHFLIDEPTVSLCSVHHLDSQILIGHWARSFNLDEQIHRGIWWQTISPKGKLYPGYPCTSSAPPRSAASNAIRLPKALPSSPSGPWPIRRQYRVRWSIAIASFWKRSFAPFLSTFPLKTTLSLRIPMPRSLFQSLPVPKWRPSSLYALRARASNRPASYRQI